MGNHKQEIQIIRNGFGEEYKSSFDHSIYIRTKDDYWFSINTLAEFFGVNRQNIEYHYANGLLFGEFTEKESCKSFSDLCKFNLHNSSRRGRPPKYMYNFDVLFYCGMHITTPQAKIFQKWVKSIIKEKLDETHEKRQIEKQARCSVRDVFKLTCDYGSPDTSKNITEFEMLVTYASTNMTPAEIKFYRADSEQKNMGLTTFSGRKPTSKDVVNSKNYCYDNELEKSADIVKMLYGFCEFYVKNTADVTGAMLVKYLKEILQLSNQPLLEGYGSISSGKANNHVKAEYAIFKEKDYGQTKLDGYVREEI